MSVLGAAVIRAASWLGAALVFLVSESAAARAEDATKGAAEPTPAAPSRGESPAEPLRLRVELGASALDPDALRAEIERELGRLVVLVVGDSVSLTLVLQEPRRLVLEYTDERSGKIERRIDLPADPRRANEVIALLVGNVVRDEAAELLRALEPAPKAEGIPEADTPAPPAADSEPKPETARAAEPPSAPAAPTPSRASAFGLRSRFDSLDELIDGPIKLNASLFYPVALWRDSDRRILNLELGLLYSNVGAIRGVALNFGALVVRRGVRGLAFASWTQIYGPSRGLTASLLFNANFGPFRGVLLSSAVNLAESQRGAAIAAGVNVIQEVSRGALIAPVNVAQTVRGVSIGVVNVADRVDGLQIGVVNVAREVRGASIGLASIAGNGSIQPTYWFSTGVPHHLGVKFVTGYVYSELSWGFSASEHAIEAGLGPHFRLSRALYLEPGVQYTDVQGAGRGQGDSRGDLHYRLRLGLRLFNAFDLFAGGGLVQRVNGPGSDRARGEALFGIAAL